MAGRQKAGIRRIGESGRESDEVGLSASTGAVRVSSAPSFSDIREKEAQKRTPVLGWTHLVLHPGWWAHRVVF